MVCGDVGFWVCGVVCCLIVALCWWVLVAWPVRFWWGGGAPFAPGFWC